MNEMCECEGTYNGGENVVTNGVELSSEDKEGNEGSEDAHEQLAEEDDKSTDAVKGSNTEDVTRNQRESSSSACTERISVDRNLHFKLESIAFNEANDITIM